MTLYVVVVAGQSAGARHPIKKDLIRLGSAAGCEICITGDPLPAHALSLEISDDQCRIYNRMDRAINCAGKTISPNGSGSWPLNADAEIAPGLVLRIEHGEAATATSAATAWEEFPSVDTILPPGADSTSDKAVPQVRAKSSQSVAQLVITICCLGASAMLLWHKFGPKGAVAPSQREVVTLNTILDQLQSQTAPHWSQVRQAIQEAYRLERSGDAAGARKRYAKVVQFVLARQSAHLNAQLPESGNLSNEQRTRLQDLASQLPEGLDRSVFSYAMNRL